MPVWMTYALLLACAAAFGFAMWVSGEKRREQFPRAFRFSTAIQLGALVLAYVVVRPGTGDDGPHDITVAAAANKPVFVDLYSNF